MQKADSGQVEEWIRILHGKSTGMLHVCSTGDWTGIRTHLDRKDDVIKYALQRDSQGVSGLYLRVTTLSPDAPSDRGKRAGADWSASFPGLWADIDIAGPGHKHTANHPDLSGYDPRRAIQFPLPPDEEAARSIVSEAGMPQPTLWINSGGGLYPWWLLDEPERLEGDQFALDAATKLSDGWQRELVSAAQRLGVDYGNVGDLARVMRLPGTVNRKGGGERLCRIVEGSGPRYTFESLVEFLFELQERSSKLQKPVTAPQVASPSLLVPPPAPPTLDRVGSPLDAFERQVPWSDILEPHGWQVHHMEGGTTHWTRPGKRTSEGSSATTGHSSDGHDRMWVFSTACGLPVGEPITKPYVWSVLNGRGGDMKKVAKDLVTRGFGAPLIPAPGFTTRLTPVQSAPREHNGHPVAVVTEIRRGAPAPVTPITFQVGTTPQPDSSGWHPRPVHPAEPAELPPFPLHTLPPAMGDLVRQVAASRQVDPIMPALFALSTISAVAAGKVEVRRNGNWTEPLSLYTCPVAESGERKSPTGRAVFGAVGRIERQMAAAHNDEVDRQIDELDQRRAEARGNPAAANRIEDKIVALEASRKRPPTIALPNDITPEALVRSLARQGGHGAILDAEGTFMGILSGRYTNGIPNPELLIKAYDGDPYTADRISRDPDRISRPTLALGLAVQQIVLEDAMNNRQLLERGALARIVFGFPKSLVGSRWESNAAPYDPGPERGWAILMEGIAELPAPEAPGQVLTLALSPEALREHVRLSDQIEARLAPGGDLTMAGLKEWAHKQAGRVLRIAALLHLADGLDTTSEIQLVTMRNAALIGEWAIAHARRAHRVDRESAEEATVKQCTQVLDWIKRTKRQAFTVRDACRGIRAQWVSTKSMGDALDQLAELGWVREEPYQDRAGRWRTRFAVSPYASQPPTPATM